MVKYDGVRQHDLFERSPRLILYFVSLVTGWYVPYSWDIKIQKNDGSKPKILSVKSYSAVVIFCKGGGRVWEATTIDTFSPLFSE